MCDFRARGEFVTSCDFDRIRKKPMPTVVLESVRSGAFAKTLRSEAENGYPKLRAARNAARSLPIEKVYERLKKLSED